MYTWEQPGDDKINVKQSQIYVHKYIEMVLFLSL